MRALVLVHAETRNVSVRDLFRAAYMERFGKDIPAASLDTDVETFHKKGDTPPYVIGYFLRLIGGKTERR